MNHEALQELLQERDRVVAAASEFEAIDCQVIENEAIRELGRIVMETSNDDSAVFSST